MYLAESLAQTQSRISEALRHVPGASALYVFGSCATPYLDPYADIDMQLVSVDMAAARAVWPRILEDVGPIEWAWPITSDAEAISYSVLFSPASPYHKLDIGISSPADAERSFDASNGYLKLWTQEPAHPVDIEYHTEAYVPKHGSVGHTLIGELMSAVRYVKARKREHFLTCWRFIRGKPELLIALLDEQDKNWTIEKTTLTTWDYKALDRQFGATGKHLHDLLDWSTSLAMDGSLYRLTSHITKLLQEKARVQGEHVPAAPIERHLSFIQTELGLEPVNAVLNWSSLA